MGRISWIVACALLALVTLVPAAQARDPLPTIELRAGEDAPEVARQIRYTRGLGNLGNRTAEQILAADFRPISGRAVHFGPPGERTAVALRVRNVGDEAGSWILTTGRGSLSYFRLYEVTDDGLNVLVDGTDPAKASRNLRTYQAFSTELVLEPGRERTLLIDFLSHNSTYLPLRIETYATFFEKRRANIAMVAGVVLGVAVLIFLNFVFFSITGHREFAWLALAQGFFAINTIHAEGYITIFFLPDDPLLGLALEDAVKCGFAASMAQFARSFVRTAERMPRLDLVLKALIIAGIAVIALQAGLALYDPALRGILHTSAWAIAVGVALFLPFVGYAAMRRVGHQLWPLLVGWGSLALFIVYAAIASMGIFAWLPINWHLAGPVGLFESLMVTLALGLNLRKIQADKRAADENYARSMGERLAISERAARLADEKAFALETVNSQSALLHASGHDSRQVILALNSAVEVLKRTDHDGVHRELTEMLRSSADYLGGIATTTISGAALVGGVSDLLAVSAVGGQAGIERLRMMLKAPFAGKNLSLTAEIDPQLTLVSDRPLLMRALANLLSNSYHYTVAGGANLAFAMDGGSAAITLSDTGVGMSEDLVRQMTEDSVHRGPRGAAPHSTGSGFRSARRLIESLSGTLEIVSSGSTGTVLRVLLPCAQRTTEPCSIPELAEEAPGWTILDFDKRENFESAVAARGASDRGLAAATYDDSTVTRGRLGETVDLMLVKPLCREMRLHPAFGSLSEQV